MHSHHSHKKRGTITIQVVCAIAFCLFSFIWLFWSQPDVLTVAQHAFSNGQTHYNRTIGAIIITLVLLLLQQIVSNSLHLNKRVHALTYVPSMLALAEISNYTYEMGISFPWLRISITVLVVLLLWAAAVWMSRQALLNDLEKAPTHLFSRRSWVNLLMMVVMMLTVACIGNTNAVFHFRAHSEVAIMQGNYNEALRTGFKSNETDVSLTMLRVFALSKQGLLGERLFEYPVSGRSQDLLPLRGSKSRLLFIPSDSIYRHLGARPIGIHSPIRYFDLLEKDSLATPAVADYRLCAYLIDKKLSDFVAYLPQYYDMNGSLPKFYREALTLYVHSTKNPSIDFSHEVMNEDWENFQSLVKAVKNKTEKDARLYEQYSNSYWYYYFFQ